MSATISTGRVVKVAGPVVDVEFPPDALPEIYFAIEFDIAIPGSKKETVVAEVAQHLGDNRVRAIAMKPTDGLVRGAPARNTGA
ncbi:MAG TPA: F0F1 ATP synthase subunit beta, partial [Acidimicrobiia bacterium]|nr:F0F1 ATP synthase subunit beta [Acidimicrobiia bacterium]